MIILASQSAIRKQLLQAAGVDFTVESSPFNEEQHKQDFRIQSPLQTASSLAAAKAMALSHIRPAHTIIGADQTLEFDGELIHKCKTLDAATILLKRLSGHTHLLHAAVCVATNGQSVFSQTSTVQLQMRPMTNAAIATYLDRAGPTILHSVGCYHYEGLGIQLFDRVTGDYHAILGLPLLPLLAFLREIGELDP